MNQVYENLFDGRPRLGHAIQAFAYLAYPPRQPVCGGAGPLVRPAGRLRRRSWPRSFFTKAGANACVAE
jgi:hypothetical protein